MLYNTVMTVSTPSKPTSLQNLLAEMLEERGADTLSKERSDHYLNRSKFLFMILGASNPFTVDPTDELEAYKKIQDQAETSGYW